MNGFEDGWLKLGVAAELGKRYGADARDFVELLATLLQGALPEATTVERGGGWLSRAKPVRRLQVALDDLNIEPVLPLNGS